MRPTLTKALVSFFINGITFTTVIFIFHLIQDEIQKWWQYALQFVVFGATMAYINYRARKKHDSESRF